MKNYWIGYITRGHCNYDEDVWELLSRRRRFTQRCFGEFNHLDLADCFLLAGADIRTKIEDGEIGIEIFIDPNAKSDFLTRLDQLITEKFISLTSGW